MAKKDKSFGKALNRQLNRRLNMSEIFLPRDFDDAQRFRMRRRLLHIEQLKAPCSQVAN